MIKKGDRIMQPIIKLCKQNFSDSTKNTVNARELHAFLANKDHFATWIKDRITQYDFIENQDFVIYSEFSEKGRPRVEYALSLDMAKELSMVERTDKGKQARQYFINCEKRLSGSPQIPQTLPEALRLAADLAEQVHQLQPKAAALDLISEKNGDLCLSDAAKTLGIRPKDLINWLQAHRWIFKHEHNQPWKGYQPKINSGHLRHVEHEYTSSNGQMKLTTQVRVTAKGLTHLAQQLTKKGIAA